jgi:DNA-binding CsgD family transcriptional regulator/tetratricopeptide (TPR) repeat protein
VLAGREAELRLVSALIRQARQGVGGALLIRGEPGIGKSALLEEAAAEADDFLILRTTGVESESTVGYAGLTELLRPMAGMVADLPPGLREALSGARRLDSATDAFVVAAAFASLLVAAAEEQPVLMLVDDVQWLDAPSARAVAFAARRLRQIRVASMVGWREATEAPVALDGLAIVNLHRLADDAADRLLDSVGAEADARARVRRAAAGNPLALLELARDPDNLERGSESVAERLFGARLDNLGVRDRAALLVAALDRSGDASVVASAAGEDGISTLKAAGLVEVNGGRVVLRHPLLRALVVHRSGPDERRAAHAALAAALKPGDERTRHLALSTDRPDEALARELEALGRRGADMNEGAWLLERAAELSPPGPDRGRRLTLAARAMLNSGDVVNVRRLIRAARDAGGPVANQEATAIEARLAIAEGDLVEGARLLGRVAEDIAHERPQDAAKLLIEGAIALTTAHRLLDGWELLRRARDLALDSDPAVELAIASAEADLSFASGDIVAAVRGLRAAALLADAEPAVHRDPRDRLCLAEALFGAGLYDRAREVAIAVAQTARRQGALGTLRFALSELFGVELLSGRIFAASAAASEELELATQFGLLMEQEEALGHMAWCDALEGRADACRQRVQERYELGRRVFSDVVPHPAIGILELGLGNLEEAIVAIRRNLDRLAARGGFTTATLMPHQPDLVEAYVRSDRRSEAAELLAEFEREARQLGVPQTLALVHRCRGLLAGVEDVDDEFAKALEFHEQEPRPLDRARTLLCWGERARQAGRRSQARARLSEALEQFTWMGAELWAHRAHDALVASGQTGLRRRDPPERRVTAAESRVASLVAEGLSNREVATRLFVSVNTIETHLRHLFVKLDVRSRTELSRKITEIRDSSPTL